MLICNNCGTENNNDLKYCEACGAKLGSEVVEKEEVVEEQKDIKEETNLNKKQKKGKKNPKVYSSTKLMYTIILLVATAFVLLYGSGTFEQPEPDEHASHANNFDDVHKGVDLNQVKKINELEAEVNKNPKDFDKLLQLAHLLNDSRFHERAIEKYEIYLKQDPNNPDVIIDMGVCYFEMGNYPVAIETMEKALKINPIHQIGHFNLGIVKHTSGNTVGAKKDWQKAISLDPNSRIAQRAQELLNNN